MIGVKRPRRSVPRLASAPAKAAEPEDWKPLTSAGDIHGRVGLRLIDRRNCGEYAYRQDFAGVRDSDAEKNEVTRAFSEARKRSCSF